MKKRLIKIAAITGVWGDLSGARGDLTDCDLTDTDRKNGVNITDLIAT